MQHSRYWVITGKVQGVGFRPFVYRLAYQHGLHGWVRNNAGQVEIQAQGERQKLDLFNSDLINQSPMIADPQILSCKESEIEHFTGFRILASETGGKADIHVPPDYSTCQDCLAEMQNPEDRRYQYPFINCTQCGPRYTLIESLPYDRANTSMAEFPLCDDCHKEYTDPLDRRFHAEPLACPTCGPQLHYKDPLQSINDTAEALGACIKALRQGQIVAVKGVGGYHLMCDASNDSTIQQLRKSKGRPHKPLAVMFPTRGDDDLDAVREAVILDPDEADLLRSPSRPIVLARRQKNSLSDLIAPGLGEIGVMLAYSPLHFLILKALDRPLIATSANISGEPVLIDQHTVEQRLDHITGYFLHHNRRIVRPADDSVYRSITTKPRPIRLGRGYAPIEIKLPFQLAKPVLACGSHMKNTVALAWDNRLLVSPHIGDLDSPRSMQVFEQTIDDLQCLYQVKPTLLACDAHPGYASTRWAEQWAEQNSLPVMKIQHHQAHASALVLEYWNDEPWLIFSWDGTGYGDDGSLWGGETFYGRPGNWQRVATFRPFHLPGGEKAGCEPWRSASALCWEQGLIWPSMENMGVPQDSTLLRQAWERGINSPETTAVGRLFDAAAALTGLIQTATYEGQGPMLLEQACAELYVAEPLPIIQDDQGIWQADWADLLPTLLNTDLSAEQRATYFHTRIAHTLIKQVEIIRRNHTFTNIGLCGGVFQNRKLTEYISQKLEQQNDTVNIATKLPVNDAGISAGQIIEAAMTPINE